ncbi:Gfo/Idh/MocA family oxidoreductase [Brevibacillus parabrevis]|uniref:Gfo/Idh/MocA family protein n=1 Tax=Brevibacillus parabrevis TaxID=54914 RepID=UPI0028CFF101|nr:Gfo/Idh/MocA family oxidoreductase [Brevibacillus parabrevis]
MRFGVIGTNWITDEFIQAGLTVEGFSLQAVYSRTSERAQEFAEKYQAPFVYTDIKEMASSGTIDAIYIASPNCFHAEQAILCMDMGLHVLCEKPFASNAAEVEAMLAAAKRNDVLLMEAVKSTLVPNFSAVRDHLPKLGTIRRYIASNCQYSSRYDAYRQGQIMRAFDPAYSNGALLDIGIYCLYPAIVLFGKPEQVKAEGVLLQSGVDGEGSMLLKYENMDAVISFSKITTSYQPAEIQGEDATMVIDKINHLTRIEIRYRDGRIEDVTRPQTPKTMHYEIREFIRLAEAGLRESETNSHTASRWTMEVMDEARRQIGVMYPADLPR